MGLTRRVEALVPKPSSAKGSSRSRRLGMKRRHELIDSVRSWDGAMFKDPGKMEIVEFG